MSFEDLPEKSRLISRRALGGMVAGGSAMALLAAGRIANAQDKSSMAGGTLEDHHEIKRLLHRYARGLDDRDNAALLDCFVPGRVTPEQAEKTIAFHRKFEYTVHNVLNPAYMIRDNTAAGMHYSLVTYVRNVAGKLSKFDTYARYPVDELVKQDGQWRFSKREWIPIFSTEEIPVMKELPPGFSDGFKKPTPK
jgi:hypothetical protein